MKPIKKNRDKRLSQFNKIYNQVMKDNENHLEELYKIIKDNPSTKEVSNLIYNYLEENLSNIIQFYKENYSSFNREKTLDFNNLLYNEDDKTLDDRVKQWVETEQDPQKLLYHLSLILNTETKHMISKVAKNKITTPYVEIIGNGGECDHCSQYVDGNVYLEDEIELPPYHPGCECEAIYYETEDLEKDDKQ